jgi:glucans biosynthesis protein C
VKIPVEVETPGKVPPTASGKRERDISIDYLRAVVTLMVLAHHSSLAYTTFAHFDSQHIFDSTAPVVDTVRWAFLDYAENFNDVFFMSLMFFISGLFVFPALRRHGVLEFVKDRFLRLGLPFAFTVTLLMPIAYYASWQLTGRSTGYIDFWSRLASGGFDVGPPWFIWVLLLFDCMVAALFLLLKHFLAKASAGFLRLSTHPVSTYVVLTLLAAAVYLPLLAKYGFGAWTNLITAPFSFQISRIGLYALWFLTGCFLGNAGLEHGLLSRGGLLARRWPVWILWCAIAYNALWFVPKLAAVQALPDQSQGALEAALWVISNVASSFAFVALFRGAVSTRRPWMDSMARSAYVMYLVHYVFVTWTQWLLLGVSLPAGIKFLLVFLCVTALSWLTAQVALRIPGLRSVV